MIQMNLFTKQKLTHRKRLPKRKWREEGQLRSLGLTVWDLHSTTCKLNKQQESTIWDKAGLKLNIKKTKITASCHITAWQIDGETVETVAVMSLLLEGGSCLGTHVRKKKNK